MLAWNAPTLCSYAHLNNILEILDFSVLNYPFFVRENHFLSTCCYFEFKNKQKLSLFAFSFTIVFRIVHTSILKEMSLKWFSALILPFNFWHVQCQILSSLFLKTRLGQPKVSVFELCRRLTTRHAKLLLFWGGHLEKESSSKINFLFL